MQKASGKDAQDEVPIAASAYISQQVLS